MTKIKTAKHTTHIEHLPHANSYVVYCDRGCTLGWSAVQRTFAEAVTRAEIHSDIERPVAP